ncbi:MAG: serine/threonine protein kinase [Clostridia bacterium]|nr:serine/threonine protein kinase [Clostridia bacterium]NCC44026.1 serine/threonine protein kinase [Clostridia bacterium]
MIDPDNVCLGCMREKIKDENICSRCGFDQASYQADRNLHWLPLQTILAGKYMVGKVIGEGGFGITYMGWDLNLEMPVAIKEYFPVGLITRDTIASPNMTVSIVTGSSQQHFQRGLDSFTQEAKTLAKFQQMPGVVLVRDFFHENNTAYLVMELVRGQSLKEVLKKISVPMSETAVLKLMFPLLDSLGKIHQENVIHRDISPDNILVDGDKVTLIDFGAARFVKSDDPKSLTVLLKHGYAPVEQYQTRGNQGPWTDIYALCATMYRMVSGLVPDEAINRIINDEVIPLKILRQQDSRIQVSDRFSDAIQKGLEISAEKRFQSIGELIEALYGNLPEENVEQKIKTQRSETNQGIRGEERRKKKQTGRTSKGKPGKYKGISINIIAIVMSVIIIMGAVVVRRYWDSSGSGETIEKLEIIDGEYIELSDYLKSDIDETASALGWTLVREENFKTYVSSDRSALIEGWISDGENIAHLNRIAIHGPEIPTDNSVRYGFGGLYYGQSREDAEQIITDTFEETYSSDSNTYYYHLGDKDFSLSICYQNGQIIELYISAAYLDE